MRQKVYSLILCVTLALGLTACSSATLSTEQRLEALRGAYYVEVQELKARGFSDAEIDAMLASGMFKEIIGDSLVTAENVTGEAVAEETKPSIRGYEVTIDSKNSSYIKFRLDSKMHIATTESGTMEYQDMMNDALLYQDDLVINEELFDGVDISRCDTRFRPMLRACNDFITRTAMKTSTYNPEDFVVDVQGEDQAQKEALEKILFDLIYAKYVKWNQFDEVPVTAKVNGYIWDVKAMADAGGNSYRTVSAEEIKAQQDAIAEAERIAEEARIAEVKRLEEERLEQERKEAEAAEAAEQAAAAAKGKVVKTYNFTQSQYTPDPAIGAITVNEYSSGYREAVFSYAGKEYIYEVLYEDYIETYYIVVGYEVPGVWLIQFYFDGGDYCFSDGRMG